MAEHSHTSEMYPTLSIDLQSEFNFEAPIVFLQFECPVARSLFYTADPLIVRNVTHRELVGGAAVTLLWSEPDTIRTGPIERYLKILVSLKTKLYFDDDSWAL